MPTLHQYIHISYSFYSTIFPHVIVADIHVGGSKTRLKYIRDLRVRAEDATQRRGAFAQMPISKDY
jgi:hypothetical protein